MTQLHRVHLVFPVTREHNYTGIEKETGQELDELIRNQFFLIKTIFATIFHYVSFQCAQQWETNRIKIEQSLVGQSHDLQRKHDKLRSNKKSTVRRHSADPYRERFVYFIIINLR